VVELARNCPLLRRAKFEACELLSDASLLALARSCPKLAALNFNYCDQLTDVGVAAVATQCGQLEEVRLGYSSSRPHLCCYFQLTGAIT
jgi:F-box and leucine-rich repeat protein GRR1